MQSVDERVERVAARLSEEVDRVAALEAIRRKKARRRTRHRLNAALLVAATMVFTVAGFLGLTRLFVSKPPADGPGGPPTPGGLIAVTSLQQPRNEPRAAGPETIYVMNADGTDPRNLTPDEALYRSPSWSPDGRRLAMVRIDTPGPGGVASIYVMNADGTGLKKVYSSGQTNQSIIQVDWSPDGRRLGFVRVEWPTDLQPRSAPTDITFQLVVVNADGTNPVPLTEDTWQVTSFARSPDGTRIAFTREHPVTETQVRSDLYVMNADGSGVQRLTIDGRSRDPAWSPDGTLIAFNGWGPSDEPPNPPGNVAGDIYVMAADGSGRARVTNHPAPEGTPTWSPDGRLLVFSRFPAGGPCEVLVRPRPDADGDRMPSPSPNGADVERVLVSENALGGCPAEPAWQTVSED